MNVKKKLNLKTIPIFFLVFLFLPFLLRPDNNQKYSPDITKIKNELDKNIIIKKALNLIDNEYIRCILNMIANCEGTKDKKASLPTLSEYAVTFMNTEKIIDFRTHPNKIFKNTLRGKTVGGSASGRYQIIRKTWEMLMKNYHPEMVIAENKRKMKELFFKYIQNDTESEPLYDADILSFYDNDFSKFSTYHFSPFWQDLYAIILMLEKNIEKEIKKIEKNPEEFIEKEKYDNIIKKLSLIWSTIPYNFKNKSMYESFINKSKKYTYVKKQIKNCMKSKIEERRAK
jgi:muramidase (phage lysozyme)